MDFIIDIKKLPDKEPQKMILFTRACLTSLFCADKTTILGFSHTENYCFSDLILEKFSLKHLPNSDYSHLR